MPRWLLAAFTALVIAFVLLIHVAGEPTSLDREGSRLFRIESSYQLRLHTLSLRLRVRRNVDSVRVALSARPAGDVRVAYASSLAPDVRMVAESLVTRGLKKAPGAGAFGVDIAIIQGEKDQYGPYVSYVLPTRPGDRCLVIVPVSANGKGYFSAKRLMRTQAAADQLLGPCAFFKAFGAPGPKVRQWLDRRGWSLAADGSWTVDASTNLGQERDPSGRLSWGAWNLGASALECLAGHITTCETATIAQVRSRALSYNGNILPEQFNRLGSDWSGQATRLGYRETYLLADMVRTLGREQFAKFWRSDEDVAPAFERATGTPLAEWVSHWMVRQYGEIAPRPVAVSTYSTAVAALIILLTAFIGLRVGANRQYA